jgi:Proto-chlorophyllide reductase 57 kD subunit
MEWDPEAKSRMEKAPFFIRPFIRRQAERVAKERGLASVSLALLLELKSRDHPSSAPR